jgi:hypothetical protein
MVRHPGGKVGLRDVGHLFAERASLRTAPQRETRLVAVQDLAAREKAINAGRQPP